MAWRGGEGGFWGCGRPSRSGRTQTARQNRRKPARWWHAPTATKDSDVLENGHESETEHWDTVMQYSGCLLNVVHSLTSSLSTVGTHPGPGTLSVLEKRVKGHDTVGRC
eukprot:7597136-Pyramimonas_sp.AAC.1